MKGLKKRVGKLEQIAYKGKIHTVVVIKKLNDDGYIHNGNYYENAKTLCRALGYSEHDRVALVIDEFVD